MSKLRSYNCSKFWHVPPHRIPDETSRCAKTMTIIWQVMMHKIIYTRRKFGFWYESMMFSILRICLRNALQRILTTTLQPNNGAAVRGSASNKQSSLNTKTERKNISNAKPVLVDQHRTTMNDDARANATSSRASGWNSVRRNKLWCCAGVCVGEEGFTERKKMDAHK